MRKAGLLAIAAASVAVAVLLWSSAETGVDAAPTARPSTAEASTPPSFVADGGAPAARPASASRLETPAASPAEAGPLELRVLHADGVPAQGCAVVVAADSAVVWSAVSGADGRVAGAPLAAPAVVWVGGATLAAASFPLPEPRGAHDLVLPAGDVVEGRVEIVGGPPESVPLGLAQRVRGDVPESVAIRLRAAPQGRGEWLDSSAWSLRTGVDGGFRFSGLPPRWQGRFICSDGYEPEAGSSLDVSAPESGRIIRLQRVPRVLFRVVMPGTHAAAPFAEAYVITSTGDASTGRSFTCDADGRGSVPLEASAPTVWAELQLSSADGLARLIQRFQLEGRATGDFGDVDLGDVELDERWSIPFRATEPGGAPIEGAIAGVNCGDGAVSDGTSADGTGRLDGVLPGCAELLVGAAAHETARVALPPQQPTEPVAVTLMPCATLGLHLTSSDGQPRPDLYLAVSLTERLPAADTQGTFRERARSLGQRLPKGGSGSTFRDARQEDGSVLRSRSNTWYLRDLCDVELGCVEPGAPIALRVVDEANHALWSDVVTLAEGERRVVDAIIAAHPLPFELLVTDEQGAPLQGVEVNPRPSGEESPEWSEPSLRWETDAAGRADFGGLYAPSLDVSCEKDGYANASLLGLAPGVPGHLTMTHGLGLDVRCVGADGRPALVGMVDAFAGRTREAQPVDDVSEPHRGEVRASAWHVDGLDPGPVKLTVYVAARHFDFERDASERSVTLTLPDWGELHVRGLPGAKDSFIPQVVMRPVDGQPAHRCYLTKSDLERDELVVPLIFPGRYEVSVIAVGVGNALAGPDTVEVHAGETATVTLHSAAPR